MLLERCGPAAQASATAALSKVHQFGVSVRAGPRTDTPHHSLHVNIMLGFPVQPQAFYFLPQPGQDNIPAMHCQHYAPAALSQTSHAPSLVLRWPSALLAPVDSNATLSKTYQQLQGVCLTPILHICHNSVSEEMRGSQLAAHRLNPGCQPDKAVLDSAHTLQAW
eukprot:364426-Chlamydomonas_euryale.AAC.42